MTGTYSKIDTLFDRDKDTFTVIDGAWRRPEFEMIRKWRVTEKVDGTNIRLIFNRHVNDDEVWVTSESRGKTDKAQMPGPLGQVLEGIRARIADDVLNVMDEHDIQTMTFYGEGYGPGIQSGGYYRDDPSFILFDIKTSGRGVTPGPEFWLDEETVTDTAEKLQLDRVPQLTNPYAGDTDPSLWLTSDIIEYVRSGDCRTTFAKEEREAEGVIAKAPVPLFNNRGQRVMFKLKGSDFRAGKR